MASTVAEKGSTVGGALIIAGTCIGGGMLALPIITGVGGLLPSLVLFAACWVFMATTALLLFEVCLWMREETNIVSMASRTLGFGGKAFAWVLYLFLFYSLTTAYCVGGGSIVQELAGLDLPSWAGTVIFVLVFGPVVSLGALFVDRLNRVFITGMAIALATFLVLGWDDVDASLWSHMDLKSALWGLPVVFGSFGFQGTLPSLVHYLGANEVNVRRAVIYGSAIPFLTYSIWQALILGVVDAEGLAHAQALGMNAVQPLKNALQSPIVYKSGQYFAVFALVSSFLGVTLGLRDFIADGFGIKKTLTGRVMIGLLTFAPPCLFSLLGPHVFLTAMQYAGGIGVALLLGLLPVLMVWKGRYHLRLEGKHQVRGGRPLLCVLIAFIIFELACEFAQLLG